MFCKQCGKELKEDSSFCNGCGSNVGNINDQAQASSPQTESPNQPMYQNGNSSNLNSGGISENVLATMVGKNERYYLNAFQKLNQNGKSFNWTVFFFSPIVLFYRKMYSLFFKTAFPIILISFIASIISTAGASSVNLSLMGFGTGLMAVNGVAGFIILILLAKNFNKKYYEKIKHIIIQNNIKDSNLTDLNTKAIIKNSAGVSGGSVAIFLVAVIVASIILSLINVTITAKNIETLISGSAASDNGGDVANDLYVGMAKNTCHKEYPNQSYGVAFDNFFSNPKWSYISTDDAKIVVEFTGKATYNEDKVTVLIQFTFNNELEEFEPTYMEIDGVAQERAIFEDMLASTFEKDA